MEKCRYKNCDRPVKKRSKSHNKKNGEPTYSKFCKTHDAAIYEGSKNYILYKKDKCEICGFVPVNSVQLDVDHIDGNKKNNKKSNLQTLCANCHRLKTYLNNDWIASPEGEDFGK